jgi:hypothetical protein
MWITHILIVKIIFFGTIHPKTSQKFSRIDCIRNIQKIIECVYAYNLDKEEYFIKKNAENSFPQRGCLLFELTRIVHFGIPVESKQLQIVCLFIFLNC